MGSSFSLKQRLGAALIDVPHYLIAFVREARDSRGNPSWVFFRNRRERLIASADGPGVLCDWQWTSRLHAPKVFPALGQAMMNRALRDWPIRFAGSPPEIASAPEVSFIIGHKGTERIPHLLMTLRALFAQENARCEFIVVEQDHESRLGGLLPERVRHIRITPPEEGMPYSRSWGFNVGAKESRGQVLVFHDGDTCAPAGYASEILAWHRRGYQAMRLQRFVFYLGERATRAAFAGGELPAVAKFDAISQNNEGVTIAVDRDSFFRIGGFDEGFLGWGGEDNELFDRVRVLPGYLFGYLPFVHLWHGEQPGKTEAIQRNEYFENRMKIPRNERIAELCSLVIGTGGGPVKPGQVSTTTPKSGFAVSHRTAASRGSVRGD